jgi:hypothetical protein
VGWTNMTNKSICRFESCPGYANEDGNPEQSTGMGVYKNRDRIQTGKAVSVSCISLTTRKDEFFKKSFVFFWFLKKINYFCIHVL